MFADVSASISQEGLDYVAGMVFVCLVTMRGSTCSSKPRKQIVTPSADLGL
jgi:hypothetical protein